MSWQRISGDLPYFNAWRCEVPDNVSQDRNSAFRYALGGIRKLALDGFCRLLIEGQDDSFEVTEIVLDFNENMDTIVGLACFRSDWGTVKITVIGKKGRLPIWECVLR